MTVTSTQFQKRPGYYFSLAAKGEKVIIKQSKPVQRQFVLSLNKASVIEKKSKIAQFLEDTKDLKIKYPEKNGVSFQRRVRR